MLSARMGSNVGKPQPKEQSSEETQEKKERISSRTEPSSIEPHPSEYVEAVKTERTLVKKKKPKKLSFADEGASRAPIPLAKPKPKPQPVVEQPPSEEVKKEEEVPSTQEEEKKPNLFSEQKEEPKKVSNLFTDNDDLKSVMPSNLNKTNKMKHLFDDDDEEEALPKPKPQLQQPNDLRQSNKTFMPKPAGKKLSFLYDEE